MHTLKSIEDFLDETSNFTMEAAYMIKANPENYETILPFLKDNIQLDSSLFGSALALDSEAYLHKSYCKYFYRGKDSINEKWLMPPAYDYSKSDWFIKPKTQKNSVWSEPYFDKGGGEVYMSTYSYPILDRKDDFIGVVTADVELNTLSKRIQQLNKGKEEKIFLVSKSGFFLSHPDKKFNLKKDIFDYAKAIDSEALIKAGNDIKVGKPGIYSINLPEGNYTLYTMYVSRTSWSIGILLKNSVLFKSLKELKIYLLIIMLADILLILIMVVLVSSQLKKSVAKEEKAKHELELASKIQQHFLPKVNKLKDSDFSLSGLMIPAKEVGGDFYGYRQVDEKLIFYVGDVSGKGVPASLFMMAAQMLMEDAMDESCDPAFILNRVNQKILKISTTGMFATMIVGVINFDSNLMTYAIAGHPPFVIKSGKGVFSPIPIYALPVAAFEGIIYENQEVQLEKGSSIIAFSDGVSEAENVRLELYDTDRVAMVLQASAEDDDALAIKDQLLKSIRKYTNGHEQNDDLTIVVVKI
jgi:sigma-B regulation protein RsbU (phosphoserine phosphatase)